MRLTCGRLGQCGVRSVCLSMNFGSIKIRLLVVFTPSLLPSIIMSATAKSTTPIAPVMTESKDWTKAFTPELQSSSEDESDILDTKSKEHHQHKQVKREEKQHREEAEKRACEEVEVRAREEVERAKVEVEHKVREEAEHGSRQRRTGWRCNEGLQRLLRGRGH